MHKLKFGMLALSAVFLFISNPGLSLAEVVVQGDITEDTVWTASESPYLVEGQPTVATGTTLTVEPGTVVKFHGKAYIISGLNVKGSLVAEGTQDNPIYFTSYRNDAVGTTSLSDGVAPGHDWSGIQFFASSTGSFNHVEINYNGNSDHVPEIPIIFNTGGTVTIDNSVVSSGFHYGIGQTSGSVSVTNSTVGNFTYGIAASGGDLRVEQNIIQNNNGTGVYSSGSGDVTLVGNKFINNNIATDFSLEQDRVFIHSDNTASGGHEDGIVLRGPVNGSYVLEKDKMPYLISEGGGTYNGPVPISSNGGFLINSGGSVTFGPSSVVKFLGKYSEIKVDGSLITLGTVENPVYLTSIHNSDINGVSTDLDTSVWSEYWGGITLNPGSVVNLDHTVISYIQSRPGNWGALNNLGGELSVTNSEITGFQNNLIEQKSGTTTISYSSIQNNRSATIRNDSATTIDARNNYWGDASGPEHANNPDGKGAFIYGDILFEPWLTTWPPEDTTKCSKECYSNVLFLPGIMSSELYEGSDKRWEPGGESDVGRLYLDENGKSINSITTGDVISTFDGPSILNADIYKSFLSDLNQKKDSGFIADYSAYSYDWRLSLEDILADGSLEDKLRELASSSKSGKVTIVAHSNGGLLVKALINKIEENGATADLVDNIVFVGVPQLGTPQAIGSLLHGYHAGLPFDWLPIIYSSERAREFSNNAPFTYNLLPHSDYYSNVGSSISTPLVSFSDGKATQSFIDTYGYAISNNNELRSFLRGDDGRNVPSYSDLVNPAKDNDALFGKSLNEIGGIDSGWVLPEGIKLYEIAGVGELTVAGIEYKTFNYCSEVISGISGWHCNNGFKTLGYSPVRVYDGDETVVEPSALAMPESDSVERLWVDLGNYNDDNSNVGHKDLFEVPDIRNFIFDDVITSSSTDNFTYLSQTKPYLGAKKRLSFTLHSPLSLSYTESDGTVVDELHPEGKHTRYNRYGEVQIVDIFDDETGSVVLNGEASGSFTLDVEEFGGNDAVATTSYAAIPSATSTIATVEVSGGTVADTGELKVDYNGDGVVDTVLAPVEGETVTPAPPTFTELINVFKQTVAEKVTNPLTKQMLTGQADMWLRSYEQQQQIQAQFSINPFVSYFSFTPTFTPNYSFLKMQIGFTENQLDTWVRFKRLDRETADLLKDLLSLIKNSL